MLFGALSTWVTPIWLLAAGATLGLVILGLFYVVVYLLGTAVPAVGRFAALIPGFVREGVLLPIFVLCLFLAAFTVLGAFAVPYDGILNSLMRLSEVGPAEVALTVPPNGKQEVPFTFRATELQNMRIEAEQDVTLNFTGQGEEIQSTTVEAAPAEAWDWKKGSGSRSFWPDEVQALTLTNSSGSPAKVNISYETNVEFPEVRAILTTAAALVILFVGYFALRILFPKVTAIAVATAREGIAQPGYYLLLAVGAFLLLAFVVIPYNTFGEDVKMLKDTGMTLIKIMGIGLALWTASTSVAEEIEGKTALTVLSKPIGRQQFVIGKFLGVLGPVLVLFILLGTFFLATVSFKTKYDAREAGRQEPNWRECYSEMMTTVPGLVLAFQETVVLAAISVAISTRLPMLPNLVICASIYVLGHLVPMLVNSAVGRFPLVTFMGQLIATVLPVLDHFDIQAAVAGGVQVPNEYLLWSLGYCVLYSAIAMLVALFLFEDRDLA